MVEFCVHTMFHVSFGCLFEFGELDFYLDASFSKFIKRYYEKISLKLYSYVSNYILSLQIKFELKQNDPERLKNWNHANIDRRHASGNEGMQLRDGQTGHHWLDHHYSGVLWFVNVTINISLG